MMKPLRAAMPCAWPIVPTILFAATLTLTPNTAWACACGCSVFDVGASTMFPGESDTGLMVWLRYSYMNQNQNWEGGSKAPASDNGDKEINTEFYTFGGQYQINSDWTVMTELPIFDRQLTTTDDGTVAGPAGSVYTGHITDLGDLQISGIYTGIAEDLSTGITFGVKLPTGNFTGPKGPLGGLEFDRDSLPGTGSTDLMIGAYHVGTFTDSLPLGYFVQARYQFAVLTQDQYRPGNELDGAVGVSYDFGEAGPFDKIAPGFQLIGSYRDRDTGANADAPNSGYRRVLAAPGIELRIGKVRAYADVELPIYQFTTAAENLAIEGTSGQLIASALYKVQLSYDF